MIRARMPFHGAMQRLSVPPRNIVAAWVVVVLVLCAMIAAFVLDKATTIQ